MLPLKETGSQIACLSGLPSLEGAQGLRDLRAKDRAGLGVHHGGGRCFSQKMKGVLALEKTGKL